MPWFLSNNRYARDFGVTAVALNVNDNKVKDIKLQMLNELDKYKDKKTFSDSQLYAVNQMLKDINIYDTMYEKNLEYFKELSLYIIAGEKKLEELKNKVFTMKEYAMIDDEGKDLDIKDPWGYDLNVYYNCVDEINTCLEKTIERLKNKA